MHALGVSLTQLPVIKIGDLSAYRPSRRITLLIDTCPRRARKEASLWTASAASGIDDGPVAAGGHVYCGPSPGRRRASRPEGNRGSPGGSSTRAAGMRSCSRASEQRAVSAAVGRSGQGAAATAGVAERRDLGA